MMFVFIVCPDACNFVLLCSKLVHVLYDKLILNLESNNKVSSTITKKYLQINKNFANSIRKEVKVNAPKGQLKLCISVSIFHQ